MSISVDLFSILIADRFVYVLILIYKSKFYDSFT